MSNVNARAPGGVTSVNLASENESFDFNQDGEEDAIGDATALRAAFNDPRYKTSESYRRMVADCIARSQVVQAPQQTFASAGRFQVTPQATHDEPTQTSYDDEHSKQMIAKFEASQRGGRS